MSIRVYALRRIGSAPAFRFGLVGLTGIVINQIVLGLLTEVAGLYYLLSAIAATQFSSTWNFVGTENWAFAGRQFRGHMGRRYIAFMAISNSTLLLRIPLLWILSDLLQINYLFGNLISLAVMFAVRFLIADGWIWAAASHAGEGSQALATAIAPDIDPLEPAAVPGLRAVDPEFDRVPYGYNVGGVLRIHSDVELPELAYFLTAPSGMPDLRIRVVRVGALPSRRTRFERVGERLTYLEQLGLAGANFRITMGEPILVEVAPLLAKSRHVLYTNVIEALLRFLMVSRGHVLLHSACVVVDGRAVLLSAQTDTGKTSTVIQLVRDRGYQFLSDDMTIIAPGGRAITYPKPMTLSYHTMAVINGGKMPRRQRAALSIQSRVHSKSGRSVGKALGRLPIPIMSVNSIVQILVPPPKYRIDALMPAEIAGEAPISHVFLMERGESTREDVTPDEALHQLIENTDDAYGFPPFATFAPHIRIGSQDYAALRAKEEHLLRDALAGVATVRVRVPGHEWAELLPGLVERFDAPIPVEEPTAIPIAIRAELVDDPAVEPPVLTKT